MSWIEKIQNELVITTGDGKEYKPNWLNANKTKEYNIAEFNFPNLAGTLVNRGTPMGRKYNLEIYFQGDSHLDISEAFERSADDPRYWTISHPYYGNIYVQPTSLNFDNSIHNITKITGTVIETIIEDNPKTTVPPKEQIKLLSEQVVEDLELVPLDTPQKADINTALETTAESFGKGVKIIQITDEFEEYNNTYNEALSAVNNAIASPVLAMRALNTFLTQPAKFTLSVKIRVDMLISTFQTLQGTIGGILGLSGKQFYQNQMSACLSGICYSVATPLDTDFKNSVQALNLIDSITDTWEAYLEDLDTLQSTNGGSPSSFIPDPAILNTLSLMVGLTISNLYNIALNSRKERSIVTETDTNIVLLTHRLYSLDPSDENMNELIDNNGWGLNHILGIKKNTRVVYYI